MHDMLVNLLDLPDVTGEKQRLREQGIEVFRAIVPDRSRVVTWVKEHFSNSGADECDKAFMASPPAVYIAAKGREILGFACYDATALDFFGPTKVIEKEQGKGIGKVILVETLRAMREKGYVYAVIGGVGPAEFYKKTVGASDIADSDPGIYRYFLGTR